MSGILLTSKFFISEAWQFLNSSVIYKSPIAFTSLFFIFIFLPVTIGGYYIFKGRAKNVFLIVMSLIFYALGEPRLVLLLIFNIIINYCFGLILAREYKTKAIKIILLLIMLIWNFGLLFYYKYFAFTLKNINLLFGTSIAIPYIIQPLGISFYTFRTVSFCLDVYWGTVPKQKNIFDVALYIAFFPQVVMGPISKYNDFSKQLGQRPFNKEQFFGGVQRIIIGLFKKLVIADTLGSVVDKIFAMGDERTVLLAWMGILGYLVQLYYDFAGYCDIAIGIGNMMGFEIPENFNYPYISKNITEYWSRWHITLGTWMKNYLYTPIFRACQDKNMAIMGCDVLALLGVWLFAGIWHGTGWNFLLYGLYYFVFIAAERLIESYKKKRRKRLKIKKQPETMGHKIFSHIYFFIVLIFGQLMFRSDSVTSFGHFFKDMFGLNGNLFADTLTGFYWKQMALAFIIGAIFCFPIIPKLKEWMAEGKNQTVLKIATPIIFAVLLIVAIAFAFTGSYQAFIYFQF